MAIMISPQEFREHLHDPSRLGDHAEPWQVSGRARISLEDAPYLSNIPPHSSFDFLNLRDYPEMEAFPVPIQCRVFDGENNQMKAFPKNIQMQAELNLNGYSELVSLPPGLKVSKLSLRNCPKLEALPEGLQVDFLDLSGCSQLQHIPDSVRVECGNFIAEGCSNLQILPPQMNLAILNLRGCSKLKHIPESVRVSGFIEVGNSGLVDLNPGLRQVEIRRNGVRLNYALVFHPDKITAQDVLTEPNAEVRRNMLELMGYEKFFAQAEPQVLYQDMDAGGPRQLLSIDIREQEPLVCVTYQCPSTGRRYATRVPPTMTTCHQAVAWIAGFDNPEAYRLVAES
jgi:hypothetical protein